MKRHAKLLIRELDALGYDHIWTNSSGGLCYAHPDDPQQTELVVNPSTDERGARSLLQRARRITGATPAAADKRNATQIKERAAAARARLAYARDKHQRLLTTPAADPRQVTAAQRLVEQRQAELDTYERLMRQPPAGGHTHRGTAAHAHHYAPRS